MKNLILRFRKSQLGINMVDLMMWLVIAALLLAAAIQGIGYYQKAAYVKQAVQSLENAGSVTMATAAMASGVVTPSVLTTSLTEAKASKDVTMFHQKAPWNSNEYILVAQHPEIDDQYIIYLFKPYGDWPAGVNVIPKATMQSLGGVFAGDTAFSGGPKINALVFPEYNTSSSYLQDVYVRTGSTNISKLIAISVDALKSEKANYTIAWSSSGLSELGMTFSTMEYSSPRTELAPAWYYTIQSGATPLPSGKGTITAVITEKATGQTASHTWNVYSNGDFALYQNDDHYKYGVATTKQVHAESKSNTFVGRVNATPYAKADYDVTMSSQGMDTIGATPTMTAGANTDWSIYIRPTVAGETFKAGNASVTLNLKHKVSGIEKSFTIPVSVASAQGSTFTLVQYSNDSKPQPETVKVAAGSTSQVEAFGVSPSPLYNSNDYTWTWTGDFSPVNATAYGSQGGSYHTTGTKLYITPKTGGFQKGTVTAKLEVTYKLTGQKVVKEFTFIVE